MRNVTIEDQELMSVDKYIFPLEDKSTQEAR